MVKIKVFCVTSTEYTSQFIAHEGKTIQAGELSGDLKKIAKITRDIIEIIKPDEVVIDFSPSHDIVMYGGNPYLCSPLHPDQRTEF